MQLEQLVERIESVFGDDTSGPWSEVTPEDQSALSRVFGEEGFQCYLQDQVNRQIIRDYLTNAVVLGHIGEPELEQIGRQAASEEGRSVLSLHMLMSSVEEAGELLARGVPEQLERLKPGSDSPPHMHLIRS